MHRRDVITLLAGATALPIAARAQHTVRVRRIGVLMSLAQNDPQGQRYIATFMHRLEELGWAPAIGYKLIFVGAPPMSIVFTARRPNWSI
jgi:hypothetical protein